MQILYGNKITGFSELKKVLHHEGGVGPALGGCFRIHSAQLFVDDRWKSRDEEGKDGFDSYPIRGSEWPRQISPGLLRSS
jgi:hypothetical protein